MSSYIIIKEISSDNANSYKSALSSEDFEMLYTSLASMWSVIESSSTILFVYVYTLMQKYVELLKMILFLIYLIRISENISLSVVSSISIQIITDLTDAVLTEKFWKTLLAGFWLLQSFVLCGHL